MFRRTRSGAAGGRGTLSIDGMASQGNGRKAGLRRNAQQEADAARLSAEQAPGAKRPVSEVKSQASEMRSQTSEAISQSSEARKRPLETQSETILEAEVLPWKADVDEAERERSQQQKRDERQGRIVNFFSADDRVEVTPEEIVGMDSRSLRVLKRQRANELRRAALENPQPRVTMAQRRAVLAQMRRGLVTNQDEHNFLLLLPDGLRGKTAEEVFAKIAADARQVQILALAVGKNAQNWREVNAETVRQILTELQKDGEDYRTPVGFMKLRRYFLNNIKEKSSPALYRNYVQSMNALERAIYGERMEYFCEFELLRREADQQEESVPEKAAEIKYTDLASERSAEILSQAVVEGDAWYGGGLERHLNIHNLTKAGLAPKTLLKLDGVEIALSDIFQIGAGRSAAIAYVTTMDGVKVRAYYRTMMQGFWRYLPDYVRRVDGQIDTFCVGYGEESVTLPLALQLTLANLEMEHGVRVLEPSAEPEFLVGGTTFAYGSHQEYQTQWSSGRMRGDYYQEVSRDPLNQDSYLYRAEQKKAPYTLSVDEGRMPDFREKIAQFSLEMADSGTTKVEGFRSNDGQYNWMFCRDSKGRAWIGGVEAISPVTSTGLRRDYVMMGDLTTPLYEVSSQTGIYGDRSDTKGARQCMWRNYLSNVPLIQEYLEKR